MKTLGIILLITLAYGAGMMNGWDAGVRDARNLDSVSAP